ncbi:MAG: glycosyltransferase, partial [Bdellovibrionales bacterium]|nr:glycosyltransferase [Bdellovibrionales bacterium]
VEEISKKDRRVHLLTRLEKQGLGRAYIAGFEWGLQKEFDFIQEMDADFSHRPEDLRKILNSMGEADFLVGSRYVPGGGPVNWGLGRKILSRGGSLYSRLILGFPLNDWTGGFNGWHSHVLRQIGLSTITSNGYSFQIELKYRALKAGFRSKEVPIIFEERRVGQSKMSGDIVREALTRVWAMRFSKRPRALK